MTASAHCPYRQASTRQRSPAIKDERPIASGTCGRPRGYRRRLHAIRALGELGVPGGLSAVRAMIRRAFPLACTGRQLALSAESCGSRRSTIHTTIPSYTHPLQLPTVMKPVPRRISRQPHSVARVQRHHDGPAIRASHLALHLVAHGGQTARRQESTEH